MKALTVDVRHAAGRVLCSTIFRPGGKKLLGKGHIIRDEDVRLLETEGMRQVWVTQLEDGEIGEDDAALAIASRISQGTFEVKAASGGRVSLFAATDCCVFVDEDLLRQLNCTSSVVTATRPNFSFLKAGHRAASVKSAPFAVPSDQIGALVSILNERGPLLTGRAINPARIGVLYSDALQADRARIHFESTTRQRLEKFGLNATLSLDTQEDDDQVIRSLERLLAQKPSLILVASTTAPAGPEDVVGRALQALGCHLERFLAPVEPGNLLLLTYHDQTPIVSAPACFRSPKPNVLDLILPPLLSGYRLSGWEVAGMGHGGLLT